MTEYEYIDKCGNKHRTVRLDVIGEPLFIQQIILWFGGTIKLNDYKVKKVKGGKSK